MAVEISAAELAEAVGIPEALAVRILPTATVLVERFAPDAPVEVQNEAAIRTAGWLSEAPSSGARREDVGDISTTFSPAATSALRSSGGMALLSPWKVRRAGVVA